MKRKILVVAVAALAGLTMLAQEKKEAAKKAPAMGGILHPEMAVENGTWDQPMATIGVKPDQPWTTTSIAAGGDSKPQPGRLRRRARRGRGGGRSGPRGGGPPPGGGKIVDFSCYIQLGKHGEKHRA